VAVFDAIVGKKNEFLRTPKFGVIEKRQKWESQSYVLPFTKTTVLEIFFSVYGCVALIISLMSGHPLFIPVIAIQTLGFMYVAYLSIIQSQAKNNKRLPLHSSNSDMPYANQSAKKFEPTYFRKEGILNTSHLKSLIHASMERKGDPRMYKRQSKAIGIGLLFFLLVSGIVAYLGYQGTIYPIDKAVAYLERAETSQTPDALVNFVNLAKENLPKEGNPVWPFATARTDFDSIHSELDALVLRGRLVSYLEPNTDSYNTALIDMHNSVQKISKNLQEAVPFLFASFTNIALASVWMLLIVILYKLVTRKNERVREYR
jgi:hypothetical protein